MKSLKLLIAAAFLAATAVVSPAAPAQAVDAASCPAQHDKLLGKAKARPVVIVHGWVSSAADMAEAKTALKAQLGDSFSVVAFDYSWANRVWGASEKTSQCLANFLTATSKVNSDAGGDGRVLAVSHSMGGIALRAAAAKLTGDNEGVLAGIVTIGTPHQGSPWGGTMFSDVFEKLKATWALENPFGLPDGDSSAALCLGWPRSGSCEKVPYLPPNTQIGTIGAQITIEKKLFNIPFVESPTATFPIFGDAIVPITSANGYVNSADGEYRSGGFVGEETLQCPPESSSYLTWTALRAPRTALVAAIINESVDTRALDMLIAGKADLSQVGWIGMAAGSKCFHGNLMTNAQAVSAAADFLRTMDETVSGSPALRASFLFQVPNDGRRNSGTATDAEVAGQTWENSTTMWVGCGWDNKTVYQLDGKYSTLTATPALRTGTPGSLDAVMKILVDGKTAHGQTLSTPAAGAPFTIDVTGAKTMEISATTEDECGASDLAYGALLDARIR